MKRNTKYDSKYRLENKGWKRATGQATNRTTGHAAGRTFSRALSLVLVGTLTLSLTACGSGGKEAVPANAGAADLGNEEEILVQALDGQVKASHSSESGKEETVYVLADAKGSINKVIVSNWMKNGEGSSSLTDVSNLKDIENVKGYEEYTAGADGSLTWNADGSDIYY